VQESERPRFLPQSAKVASLLEMLFRKLLRLLRLRWYFRKR